MGGDMMGKSPTGEDYENLGRKNYFGEERTLYFWFGIFSGVGSLVFGVLVNHCKVHRVAGGFGHGG
jgi:hypothetical protein